MATRPFFGFIFRFSNCAGKLRFILSPRTYTLSTAGYVPDDSFVLALLARFPVGFADGIPHESFDQLQYCPSFESARLRGRSRPIIAVSFSRLVSRSGHETTDTRQPYGFKDGEPYTRLWANVSAVDTLVW